jgi:hypothetical protein
MDIDQPDLFAHSDALRAKLVKHQQAVWAWHRQQGPRPSQEARILVALFDSDEVCGADLLAWRMPRYAAVIHTLRNQGWDIATMPCSHGMEVAHYALASLP